MNKWCKRIAAAMAAILAVSMTGCFKEHWENKVNKEKTQLYVGLFDGGWGHDWMDAAKARFEQLYPEYEVVITLKKEDFQYSRLKDTIAVDFNDLYITACDYNNYIAAGSILDITDAVTQKLTAFDEQSSVAEKLPDQYRDYYKFTDGKYYAVPFGSSVWGLNYDVDLFEEKLFYMKEGGGWTGADNKTVGRDGVKGTYDDGCPVTWSEFKALMLRMVQANVKPFIWSDMEGYRSNTLLSMIADHEGDEFQLFNTLSGSFTNRGGVRIDVTPNTGYKLVQMDGKRAALEFAYEIIEKGYYDSRSFSASNSFTNAQDWFIESKRASTLDSESQRIAFLIEGGHWYNEAKDYIEQTNQTFYPEYKQQGRRFSVMPFPRFYDNTSDVASYLESSYEFSMFVNAKTKVPDIAKLFVQFMNTDEMVKLSTVMSGIVRTVPCQLTEEEMAGMPYYYRVIREMAQSPKVNIVSTLTRAPYYIQYPDKKLATEWVFSGTFVDNSGNRKGLGEPFSTFKDYRSIGCTPDAYMNATLEFLSTGNRWAEI